MQRLCICYRQRKRTTLVMHHASENACAAHDAYATRSMHSQRNVTGTQRGHPEVTPRILRASRRQLPATSGAFLAIVRTCGAARHWFARGWSRRRVVGRCRAGASFSFHKLAHSTRPWETRRTPPIRTHAPRTAVGPAGAPLVRAGVRKRLARCGNSRLGRARAGGSSWSHAAGRGRTPPVASLQVHRPRAAAHGPGPAGAALAARRTSGPCCAVGPCCMVGGGYNPAVCCVGCCVFPALPGGHVCFLDRTTLYLIQGTFHGACCLLHAAASVGRLHA